MKKWLKHRHSFFVIAILIIIFLAIYVAEKYHKPELYIGLPALASVVVTWIVVNHSTEINKTVQNYAVRELKDRIMRKLIDLSDVMSMNDLYEFIPEEERDRVSFFFAIDELKQGELVYIVDGEINGKNEGENPQHGFGKWYIGEGKFSKEESSEILSRELPKINETLQDLTHAIDALNVHMLTRVDQCLDSQYVVLKQKIKSRLVDYLLFKSGTPGKAVYEDALKYMKNNSLRYNRDFSGYDFKNLLHETVFDLCRTRIIKLHRDKSNSKLWLVLIPIDALKQWGKHRPLP